MNNEIKQSIAVSLERTNAVPLDNTEVFDTLAEAESYATGESSTAYIGQVISVIDIDNGTAKLYVIQPDKSLKEVCGNDQDYIIGEALDSLSVGESHDNSGAGTIVFGESCRATSTAIGSLCGGQNCIVDNHTSVALGSATEAKGFYACGIGLNIKAYGDGSFGAGVGHTLTGTHAGAIGNNLTVAGLDSFSAGVSNNIKETSTASIALGEYLEAGSTNQIVCGSANANKSTTVFEVGNGKVKDGVIQSRTNAFEVLRDGRAKVYSAPTEDEDVVRKAELDSLAEELANTSSGNILIYSEGLEFTSNGDGTCSVTGIGQCTDTDIFINRFSPANEQVTSIGDRAFLGCSSLTSIAIPSGVTSIGDHAFSGCTNLENIIIPLGVRSLGMEVFAQCSSLQWMTLPTTIDSVGPSPLAGSNSSNHIIAYTDAEAGAFSELFNENGNTAGNNNSGRFELVYNSNLMSFEENAFNRKILDIKQYVDNTINSHLNSNQLFEQIYPVGSIYLSTVLVDPSNLFGGTWEQIQDRFLLGASSTYTAGETGGSETITLTEEQIPAHTHNYVGYTEYTKSAYDVSGKNVPTTVNAGATSTTSTGSTQAHDNMPPWLAVYMWKRIS